MQKGFIHVLPVVVLVVILTGIVGAYSSRRLPSPLPQPPRLREASALPTLPTGEQVLVKGKITCLPHRDSSRGVTPECAIGLEANDGRHYGLPNLHDFLPDPADGMDKQFAVSGTMITPDPAFYSKYNVVGAINIESLVEGMEPVQE